MNNIASVYSDRNKRNKKNRCFCDKNITEVISLLSGFGFPREYFIPDKYIILENN